MSLLSLHQRSCALAATLTHLLTRLSPLRLAFAAPSTISFRIASASIGVIVTGGVLTPRPFISFPLGLVRRPFRCVSPYLYDFAARLECHVDIFVVSHPVPPVVNVRPLGWTKRTRADVGVHVDRTLPAVSRVISSPLASLFIALGLLGAVSRARSISAPILCPLSRWEGANIAEPIPKIPVVTLATLGTAPKRPRSDTVVGLDKRVGQLVGRNLESRRTYRLPYSLT